MRYSVIGFNRQKFDFVKPLTMLFEIDLKHLHTLLETQYSELFQVGKDSSTIFHADYYKKYNSGWPEMEMLYEKFIADVVSPLFTEDFLYQKAGTIRFSLPGNVAVGDFHTDAEFHHPAGEINFIIPLTDSDKSSVIFVESEPGKNDFEPIPMRIGQLIQFNGNTLRHGNAINVTGETRVSIDFRVLPISKYNPDDTKHSITQKTKFIEGEYYKRFIK